ncbi:MAG TPA: TonB-dependent siderophore receptor [Chthoniobacterales bacterium]|jgi:iron complex outermembrane receptor protein
MHYQRPILRTSIAALVATALIVPMQAQDSGTNVIDEMIVSGEAGESSYLPAQQATGSRLSIPPRDQVQTVNTVTPKEIDDRGVMSVQQAIETTTGVRPVSGVYSSTDVTSGIRSRGFENNYTYINGSRYQAFGFPIELAVVDRLEVLKGPGGVLFGQGDPGGTLNILTKRPLSEPRHEVEATVGSFNLYRFTLDTSGPLISRDAASPAPAPDPKGGQGVAAQNALREPVLLYRLNAGYQSNESHRDFVEGQRYVVAPAVTWFIGPDTTLNVEFQYLWEEYRFDRGLPPQPITLELPRGRSAGEPDMPLSWSKTYNAFVELEHRFSDAWRVRSNTAFFYQDQRSYEISGFSPVNGNGDDGLFERYAGKSWGNNKYFTTRLEALGEWQLAGFDQQTLIGAEYSHAEFGYAFFDPSDAISPINYRNPDYGTFKFRAPYTKSFPAEAYGDDAYAVYFDHQFEIADNLKLMLGSRYDWSNGFYIDRDADIDRIAGDSEGWSPRTGVVWSPWKSTDLYASYARTFKPNLFTDGTGATFDPELGEAWEIGVRQRFFEDRFQISGAAFHIVKENILNPDPSDATGRRQILNGEERARGFEFEAKGTPLPGWDIAAGYTYLDAEVTESTTDPIGLPLVDAPEHQASLFTRYEFQSGWAKGFYVGYGVYYVDERRSSFANPTFNLPSHVRHDAHVGWRNDHWRVQANVENLFDEEYYETHGNNIFPQAGTNVRASVSYTF